MTRLMARAVADSDSLATQRDLWAPRELRLPRVRVQSDNHSVWDDDEDRSTVLSRAAD